MNTTNNTSFVCQACHKLVFSPFSSLNKLHTRKTCRTCSPMSQMEAKLEFERKLDRELAKAFTISEKV